MFPFILCSIAVDCGTLNDITNGQVSHTAGTTFGQTATYSCDTGYIRVGNSIRTCQAYGVWSGSEPTCQGVLLLSIPEHTKNLGHMLLCCEILLLLNVADMDYLHVPYMWKAMV